MDPSQPVMLRLISSAVSIASRAGSEVRRISKTGQLGVIDKGVQDFQTEADRTAQRMIVASLNKRFPKCTIVGEEDLAEDQSADQDLIVETFDETVLKHSLPDKYKTVKEEEITIWVDPLDATAEFVKGFYEHVTVLIGISVNGQSVAGVIHQPFYGYKTKPADQMGRTMWALVGLGYFGITTNELPQDKLIVTTTASHGSKNINDTIDALQPDEVLRVGGAGHKVLLVVEGRAHSYVFASNGCKRWDTCAPEALLVAAGGVFTDVFGNQINYNHRQDNNYQNYLGIVASASQKVHSEIIRKIPAEIKTTLLDAKNLNTKAKY